MEGKADLPLAALYGKRELDNQHYSLPMLALGLILGAVVVFAAYHSAQQLLKPLASSHTYPSLAHPAHKFQLKLSRPSPEPTLSEPSQPAETASPKHVPQSQAPDDPVQVTARSRQPELDASKPETAPLTSALKLTVPPSNAPSISPALMPTLGNHSKFSNVFDSRLREQLQQQSRDQLSATEGRAITSYRDGNGDLVARHGERCFTLRDHKISPTGKQWSLPQRCYGVESESDAIARGLEQAMRKRFGANSSQN
ncbi:MAG TPA: hypothetical protein VIC26_14485 [Marinagarivorans sp.]